MVRTIGWVAGLIACVVVLLAPADEPLQVVVYALAAVATIPVFAWAVSRMRGAARRVWATFLVAQALYVVADLVYDLQQYHLGQDAFPGWADPFYLAFYLAQLVALGMLVGERSPGHDREAWLDTSIMSLAAATVMGSFVLLPMIADSDEAGLAAGIAVAYPLLDVLVASALIALLVVGGWHPALGLVLLADGLMLAADIGYDVLSSGGADESTTGWVQAVYLASLVVMAGAVASRHAADVVIPGPPRPEALSRPRIAGLAVGVLVPSLVLAIVVWSGESAPVHLLALGSVGIIGLVVWRVLQLFAVVGDQNRRLAAQARTDGLTGLPNRRTWDFQSERAAAVAAADGTALSVAILDLDHFKDYNDTRGHPAGDALLIECAIAWRAALPARAFLARYGGEEFAVLLPGSMLPAAVNVLDAVRRATPGGCTVSAGVAEWATSESIGHAVDRADQALYRAKAAGRDRVVAYTPELDPATAGLVRHHPGD